MDKAEALERKILGTEGAAESPPVAGVDTSDQPVDQTLILEHIIFDQKVVRSNMGVFKLNDMQMAVIVKTSLIAINNELAARFAAAANEYKLPELDQKMAVMPVPPGPQQEAPKPEGDEQLELPFGGQPTEDES